MDLTIFFYFLIRGLCQDSCQDGTILTHKGIGEVYRNAVDLLRGLTVFLRWYIGSRWWDSSTSLCFIPGFEPLYRAPSPGNLDDVNGDNLIDMLMHFLLHRLDIVFHFNYHAFYV
jgi:hypothetical protein